MSVKLWLETALIFTSMPVGSKQVRATIVTNAQK